MIKRLFAQVIETISATDPDKAESREEALRLATAVLMIGLIVTFDITAVAKLASAFQLLLFGLLNVAVVVMRESRIDWYQPGYYKVSPETSPTGPKSSHDPQEPGVPKRVKRGGSWLSITRTWTGEVCVRSTVCSST